MNHATILELAKIRQRELHATAAQSRLAALVSCCRPSRLLQAGRAVRDRVWGPTTGPTMASGCCA